MSGSSVKKEWLLIPVALLLLVRILVLRPQLMDWQRFKTEYSPWYSAPRYMGATLPIFGVNGFESRIRASASPQVTSIYRGHPNRDGQTNDTLDTKLQITSIYSELNVGEHSASKASPAVDETGIYVGGDTGWFFGFNLDGTVRWKFHIDEALRGIHSTALLYQGRVCFGGYNATFYCLDKRDGKLLWSSTIPNGGYGASPLVIGDEYITAIETNRPANGFVGRFSLNDGRVIWRSPFLGEQAHSSPAYDTESQSLYLGANNHRFFKMDAKTGSLKWSINLGAEVKGSPLIDKDVVYITSWSRRLYALDKTTGKVKWISNLHGPSQSSPTLFTDSEVIVVGDSLGFIYGINSVSGKIIWEKPTNFEVKSSALAARLPLKNERAGNWVAWIACGRDLLCALDPKTGRVLNQYDLPGSLTGTPVSFNQQIYLALNFPGGLVKLSR